MCGLHDLVHHLFTLRNIPSQLMHTSKHNGETIRLPLSIEQLSFQVCYSRYRPNASNDSYRSVRRIQMLALNPWFPLTFDASHPIGSNIIFNSKPTLTTLPAHISKSIMIIIKGESRLVLWYKQSIFVSIERAICVVDWLVSVAVLWPWNCSTSSLAWHLPFPALSSLDGYVRNLDLKNLLLFVRRYQWLAISSESSDMASATLEKQGK